MFRLLATLFRQFSAKLTRWHRRETLLLPYKPPESDSNTDERDAAQETPADLAHLTQQWRALQNTTVEDIMTPRGKVDWLDIADPWDNVAQQLAISLHPVLPVCRETPDQLLGMLPLHRLLAERETLDKSILHAHLQQPYYIPASTGLLAQLAFFHDNQQQSGFIVDEYGEILGLLSHSDIVREIATRLTQPQTGSTAEPTKSVTACILVDANRSLRELNRTFGLEFPLDGPKTLNGLILEYFQDIPETGVSLKIGGIPLEVVQTQDRSVKTVRLFSPAPAIDTPA